MSLSTHTSWWMNSMSLPYLALSCSAMSVTGPHTRDVHSCGVANSSATGLCPRTSARSACMSDGGSRVSSIDSSPFTVASVSVCDLRRALAGVRDLVVGLRRHRDPHRRADQPPVLARGQQHRPRPGRVEAHGRRVDRRERVGLGGGLLGAVARLREQHVGRRHERPLRGLARVGRDVDRRRPVDRPPVLADHAEREPALAGRDGLDRERALRPGADEVGHLLQASCRRPAGSSPGPGSALRAPPRAAPGLRHRLDRIGGHRIGPAAAAGDREHDRGQRDSERRHEIRMTVAHHHGRRLA